MKPTAGKFCRCIKSVRKTIKARKGSTAEQGAIAVCVKSVLQTRGKTIKQFSCGKKPRLVTQRMRGGVAPSPWIHVKNTLISATEAMKARPERKAEYMRELMGRIGSMGDLPAVTPETRGYYEKSLEVTADFPEIQELIKRQEMGSAYTRRSPLIHLRKSLRKPRTTQ